MSDYSILFLLITMMLAFSYRVILSILLLTLKKYYIDEKYYISVFYCSLVGILVLFTDWLIVGIVLLILLPVILMFYVSLAPSRKYWLINGYELSEATFLNEMFKDDNKLEKASYRINHFKMIKKPSEKKIQIEFLKLTYQEKESLLASLLKVCKEKVKHSNKHEVVSLVCYLVVIFILLILMMLVLFL